MSRTLKRLPTAAAATSIPSQTGTDQTAEIITEAAGDGPSGNNHVGFINTGTVHYDTANALTWFHGSGVPRRVTSTSGSTRTRSGARIWSACRSRLRAAGASGSSG